MDDMLLEAEAVSVRFGGVTALENVWLSVREGELLGLIGPNGAGKTTLLGTITGEVRPQEGEIRLAGRNIVALGTHQRVRLGLGLSHQIVRPFPSMTLLENVTIAAGGRHTANPLRALLGRDRRSEIRRARQLLDMIGIGDAADSMPSEVPLGYLKRLEMARALALEPRVLLLDEPLAGLNNFEATRLADVISALNRDGLTIILIEHNLSEVMRVSSRLLVLDNGRRLAEGAPEAVMPDAVTRRRLEIADDEPCLLLRRRTWSGGAVASSARLVHPGSRYRLAGRFAQSGAEITRLRPVADLGATP